MALKAFSKMRTGWQGLWWHPECNCYFSTSLNLAQLKQFKGNVRVYLKKNRFYNNGENNRPNYVFMLSDAKGTDGATLEVTENDRQPYFDAVYGTYHTGDGSRLYTEEEVQYAINRAAEDGVRGYGWGDNIVSDYL